MNSMSEKSPQVEALIKLTGLSAEEVVSLRWEWIERDSIMIPWAYTKDRKPKHIQLTPDIERVLDGLPNLDHEPRLFPS